VSGLGLVRCEVLGLGRGVYLVAFHMCAEIYVQGFAYVEHGFAIPFYDCAVEDYGWGG
jgi:hypothetical protein